MLKNKNFNFALIVFALTLTVLYAFVAFYPADTLAEEGPSAKSETSETLVISSN